MQKCGPQKRYFWYSSFWYNKIYSFEWLWLRIASRGSKMPFFSWTANLRFPISLAWNCLRGQGFELQLWSGPAELGCPARKTMGTNIYSPSDHVGEPVTLVKVYSQFLQVRLPEYYLVKTLATPVQYCCPNLYANSWLHFLRICTPGASGSRHWPSRSPMHGAVTPL